MSLVTMRSLLLQAGKSHYAVGAFNFFGLENLQGILQGARDKKSPVIVQVSPGAARHIGPQATVGMAAGYAEEMGIPVALHLDHATDYNFIRKCVDAGFSSVMIDASKLPFEENIAATTRVVEYASRKGVSVEAELGRLVGAEEEIAVDIREACFTNPDDVSVFVDKTGIDALAIAVGTAHGFYKQEPKLDFDRIAAIRRKTGVALVLHGGTGVPDVDFKKAIQAGITKINVGTELWLLGYGATMKREAALLEENGDPRKVMVKVREACAEIVGRKIDVFGSSGKAH